MNIIKKKGNIEEFKVEKLNQSLINAATEIGQALMDGDLNMINKTVVDKLKVMNRETTSSYEIFAIVIYVLKELGFSKVGKAYFNGSIDF